MATKLKRCLATKWYVLSEEHFCYLDFPFDSKKQLEKNFRPGIRAGKLKAVRGDDLNDPAEEIYQPLDRDEVFCWFCLCTEFSPCVDDEAGESCHWVAGDCCSACESLR